MKSKNRELNHFKIFHDFNGNKNYRGLNDALDEEHTSDSSFALLREKSYLCTLQKRHLNLTT